MKNHKHESCANITEVFRSFIGCTVKGCLFNAFPLNRHDLSAGSKTLIFDCGWGLTISSSGAYWAERPEEVKRAVERTKESLQKTQEEIRQVLQVAGVQP